MAVTFAVAGGLMIAALALAVGSRAFAALPSVTEDASRTLMVGAILALDQNRTFLYGFFSPYTMIRFWRFPMTVTGRHARAQAALLTLIILQVVMLAALYTQTPPHPPRAIVLFALGPFLGTSISAAASAMVLGATATRQGMAAALLAAALALISFGPQKWIDPAIGEIWPAVLAAEVAVAVLVVETVLRKRAG
jgi:hypothetical protein